jgi:hypothetical protein
MGYVNDLEEKAQKLEANWALMELFVSVRYLNHGTHPIACEALLEVSKELKRLGDT